MKLAELLKLYRKWNDKTQPEVAAEIGITLYELQKIESGKMPNGDTLMAVFAWLVKTPAAEQIKEGVY